MAFPILQLCDDFTDNTIGPLWTKATTGTATGAETGGQAVFTLPSSGGAGPHEASYLSNATYNLTGGNCTIVIGTMVATGVAATAYFRLILDASNYYEWTQTSNTLKARKIVAGVASDIYSVTWSSSTYKYLRVRESGGTVYFDSSSNGSSWTSRGNTTIAAAFAVTELAVTVGATCGNVSSPGSFKLDSVNTPLPAPSSTWRYTTADWQIVNRLRSVTLASSGNAQGVIVVADSMDGAGTLSGNLKYFAGPLGSSSGGYLAMTEYASLATAQASAFPIPVDGRVDLPALVDRRYMRLYHRSTDGSAHTIYEFLPRRLVQADDVEAESISAINIAAHTITAQHIGVVDLDASALITAGGGVVSLDDGGVSIRALVLTETTTADYRRQLTWERSDGELVAGVYGEGLDATASGYNSGVFFADTTVATRDVYVSIEARRNGARTGIPAISLVNVGSGSGAFSNVLIESDHYFTVNAAAIFLNGTIQNDLTATGAITAGGAITAALADSATNATSVGLTINHDTSGTPAAGFGTDVAFNLESTTTADRSAALIRVVWATATDASRKSRMRFFVFDTAARDALTLEASGSAPMIGFLGAAPVARPTVSGSRGSNAALTSLLTALANLGLVTDSSS